MAKQRKHRPSASPAVHSGDVTLKVEVFREKHTEKGCEKVPVQHATVHVYDVCGGTEIKPIDHKEPTPGQIELKLPRGSSVRLVPRIAAAGGTPAMYTPQACGIIVSRENDRHCPIPIQFYASPAEVWASACVHDAQPAPTQPTQPVTLQQQPVQQPHPAPPADPVRLANVTFRLYKGVGLASEVVDSFTTTEDSLEAVFENLEAGYYTLRAEMSNQLRAEMSSQLRAEMVNQGSYKPCCTTQVFHVCEGECLDLGCCFCFKSITNDVKACVSDECGNPLCDVPLQLVGGPDHYRGMTAQDGMVTFQAVKVGAYKLQMPGIIHVAGDGTRWEATTPAPAVQVRHGQTPVTAALTLQRDILTIDIEVTDPHGRSQPNAVVLVYDATGTKVIDTVVLDSNGKHTWIAPADEMYYFALKPNSGGTPVRLFPASESAS